jgi:hypothetical protein
MVNVKMEYGFGSVGKENQFRSLYSLSKKEKKKTIHRLIVWNSFVPKSVSVIK